MLLVNINVSRPVEPRIRAFNGSNRRRIAACFDGVYGNGRWVKRAGSPDHRPISVADEIPASVFVNCRTAVIGDEHPAVLGVQSYAVSIAQAGLITSKYPDRFGVSFGVF